jgi:hypothetical protein
MAKRRFIWSPEDDCLVEVSADYEQPARNSDGTLWNDRHYDGLRATDGTDISSRTKHREYMKMNNLTTADDFTQSWAKAAEKRADFYQGKKGSGSVTRTDIERAICEIQNRRN